MPPRRRDNSYTPTHIKHIDLKNFAFSNQTYQHGQNGSDQPTPPHLDDLGVARRGRDEHGRVAQGVSDVDRAPALNVAPQGVHVFFPDAVEQVLLCRDDEGVRGLGFLVLVVSFCRFSRQYEATFVSDVSTLARFVERERSTCFGTSYVCMYQERCHRKRKIRKKKGERCVWGGGRREPGKENMLSRQATPIPRHPATNYIGYFSAVVG